MPAKLLMLASMMVPTTISEEVTVLSVAREPRPRLVRADEASTAPVPPLASGSVPVISVVRLI